MAAIGTVDLENDGSTRGRLELTMSSTPVLGDGDKLLMRVDLDLANDGTSAGTFRLETASVQFQEPNG
ncbi:MAG: hypothetical protein ACQEXJ_18970 [Myxococcota bacterium]